ncbi:hypothetical protein Golob_004547, partial [Gossypium lobatum]|nr:hypothetical protein [Gossypium lobatum]
NLQVSLANLYNAFVLEGAKVYSKVARHSIKSVGSKVMISLEVFYSLIEGGPLADKLEKISYENQFVAAASGGSVCKSSIKFYTISDYVITEDEIKALIQRSEVVYKAIEAYLLANIDINKSGGLQDLIIFIFVILKEFELYYL